MLSRSLSLGLLAFSLMSACNFHKDKTSEDTTGTTPTAEQINFAEVQAKVLGPYCQNCHSQGAGNLGGINLEGYAQVKSLIAIIERVTLVEKSMPRGSPLKGYPAELLTQWIAKGAPETSTP